MKKIILIALVLALGCIFVTCELDTAQFATVTFEDPIGEHTVAPVTLKRGDSLGSKLPTGYSKQGYIFHGWFDIVTQARYNSGTPIGADLTLTTRWSQIREFATVSFEFTTINDYGYPVLPTVQIPPITVEKGQPLGFGLFPASPRSKGWTFDKWVMEDGVTEFTTGTPIAQSMSVFATWIPKTDVVMVTFNMGPGGGVTPAPIPVLVGECIDEWEPRFPKRPDVNPVNSRAFFVAWLDDENREYNGRTPVTRDVLVTCRWGLPPKIVNFDTEIESLKSWTESGTGNVDYLPEVRNSVIDGRRVIVNTETYDVPYNVGRWKILYQIKMKWPSDFDTGFYTNYTIRARFYANQQGTKGWTGGGFKPNNPADESGYSRAGLLRGGSSPSDDGWGQISWTITESATGVGADPTTLLQRYNLDRKGGTINDTFSTNKGTPAERQKPPYLLIQTSDNYIGHIEVTQIVFHNGEKKYTMYTDEEGYDDAEDGL